MKLTELEEDTILERILDLDARGFPPTRTIIGDMANTLLAARGGKAVGKCWPDRFIARQPALKKVWSRAYEKQRALCEDTDIIKPWFRLYSGLKAKYGILDEDTYNFDETGFMMGVIGSRLVITGRETRGKRKALMPGNRE